MQFTDVVKENDLTGNKPCMLNDPQIFNKKNDNGFVIHTGELR